MHTSTKFICLMFLSINVALAQSNQKETQTTETKMDAFASRTGVITKFIDYKLPSLKLFLGEPAQTRIRKVMSGLETRYFYVVEKQSKTSTSTGSIEYNDLLQVTKVLATLKGEALNDLSSKRDYVENKYVTDDGFQFGYYITGGKSKWYIKLEQNGTDNTLFINDVQTIENSFNEAKYKIEAIKSDLDKGLALQH
ncbi:MAG TPA: hypothetical protein VJ184_00885 [Chryseolinea sp.]|nr:hypothetical protein [Chryseolinea sp.]